MQANVTFGGRIVLQGTEMPIDETLAILDGLAGTATLAGAVTRAGLSYRAIWGKLARIEAALGCPVAIRTKGHGTRLTETGERLRAALAESCGRLAPLLEAERRVLETAIGELATAAAPHALVLAASHDPLLVQAVQGIAGLRLDIVGSSEAVAALRAGRADLAGCHFGSMDEAPPARLAETLRAEGFTWTLLFRRAQGLMVAPGNPLGLRAIPDLATRRARFVNRQKGSGTRQWFDRLLARHAIRPETIIGYHDEEFTHHAVAAVIASGRADTGLGAQSAATKFGLDFVPLGDESYFVIFKRSPRCENLMGALGNAAASCVNTLRGYRPGGIH